MLSIETIKWRLSRRPGLEIPLVAWPGVARVVQADDQKLALLVGGRRADFTWDRVRVTWERLLADHELSVAELGGQHDAVGLVSLLAFMQSDEVSVEREQGVLRLRGAQGPPVHQPTAPAAGPVAD